MKKFLFSIIFTMLLGILTGNILCKNIHAKEGKTLYLALIGSYIDYNDAINDSSVISNKIIVKDGKSYDTYIAASFKKSNLNKITKLYKKYGFTYFIKEEEIYDKNFIKNMNNFDLIMKSSKGQNDIQKINNIMLSYYEEKFINS